jgi:hypothetical protein
MIFFIEYRLSYFEVAEMVSEEPPGAQCRQRINYESFFFANRTQTLKETTNSPKHPKKNENYECFPFYTRLSIIPFSIF